MEEGEKKEEECEEGEGCEKKNLWPAKVRFGKKFKAHAATQWCTWPGGQEEVPCQIGANGAYYDEPFNSGLCCSVFVVCCSVLRCVALCSVLQFFAMCCSVFRVLQCVAVCCSVLQCVAVCCSVYQCVAVLSISVNAYISCSMVQCVAVCCSVIEVCQRIHQLQCVAACCSVLRCVAVC